MTREEKKLIYQVIVLLQILRKETNKLILKDEIDRLIKEFENRM